MPQPCFVRLFQNEYRQEDRGAVQFDPLIGKQGWIVHARGPDTASAALPQEQTSPAGLAPWQLP